MSETDLLIDVTAWPRIRDETMGSKPKAWLRAPDGQLWLFKYPRANSGEHWSEKLAAEIARPLDLPHAEVALAILEGELSVISRDFTRGGKIGTLVHGNELLLELDPSDPTQQNFRLGKHTLDRIFGILSQPYITKPAGWDTPSGIDTAADLFVGYLLLDALIGNVDRHHENWAIIELPAGSDQPRRAELAPTFDHASSLGRELSDVQRIYKLSLG